MLKVMFIFQTLLNSGVGPKVPQMAQYNSPHKLYSDTNMMDAAHQYADALTGGVKG